jgi:hypothetical protein
MIHINHVINLKFILILNSRSVIIKLLIRFNILTKHHLLFLLKNPYHLNNNLCVFVHCNIYRFDFLLLKYFTNLYCNHSFHLNQYIFHFGMNLNHYHFRFRFIISIIFMLLLTLYAFFISAVCFLYLCFLRFLVYYFGLISAKFFFFRFLYCHFTCFYLYFSFYFIFVKIKLLIQFNILTTHHLLFLMINLYHLNNYLCVFVHFNYNRFYFLFLEYYM